MEVRVSVYLIIIIIMRPDIAIDELLGRKAIFIQLFNFHIDVSICYFFSVYKTKEKRSSAIFVSFAHRH